MTTEHKEWPDEQMLNKMWETFTDGDYQDIDWFKYAVRCELGEPEVERRWIEVEGVNVGYTDDLVYRRIGEVQRTFLGTTLYGRIGDMGHDG